MFVKTHSLTVGVQAIRADLSTVGVTGIPGVAVKCADIRRNTGGEGGSLGRVLTLRSESVGSEQD